MAASCPAIPIDLFHKPDRVHLAPTFGAKIGVDGSEPKSIETPATLASAIFDSARHTLDYDFIRRNPDYDLLVGLIDTGEHHWLDFDMAVSDQADLFARGAACARDFLRKFDWAAYKEVREGMSSAVKSSRDLPAKNKTNA